MITIDTSIAAQECQAAAAAVPSPSPPVSLLIQSPTRNSMAVVCGSDFAFLDSDTKRLQCFFLSPTAPNDASGVSGRLITAACFRDDGMRFATANAAKTIRIFDTSREGDCRLVCELIAPKRVVQLLCLRDPATAQMKLLMADKHGDVHSYPFDERDPACLTPPTLLLGHVSMITCAVIDPRTSLVITADRDEHVRFTNYPNTYDIQGFGLAHTEFVSRMALLPQHNAVVSAGGDNFACVWSTGGSCGGDAPSSTCGTLLTRLDISRLAKPVAANANGSNSNGNGNGDALIAVRGLSANAITDEIAVSSERGDCALVFRGLALSHNFSLRTAQPGTGEEILCLAYDQRAESSSMGSLWVGTLRSGVIVFPPVSTSTNIAGPCVPIHVPLGTCFAGRPHCGDEAALDRVESLRKTGGLEGANENDNECIDDDEGAGANDANVQSAGSRRRRLPHDASGNKRRK